ncbi:hypothetical protein X975_06840, partial [Stegodyphus mimosarum]
MACHFIWSQLHSHLIKVFGICIFSCLPECISSIEYNFVFIWSKFSCPQVYLRSFQMAFILREKLTIVLINTGIIRCDFFRL